MATYTFIPGIDYGPRKGTLGWNVHMAEGGNGTVTWLSRRTGETVAQWRDRVSGVSANFVILTTGAAVQMVPWGNAAGNLNPNDRSTDKAFYGRRYLLEVLGTHWTDPNAYTISVELCGFRADGPTQAQVETLVALIAESRNRYPGMVGAFGHADQTDTKGCPGTAPLMREFWDRVGHGTFRSDDVTIPISTTTAPGVYDVDLTVGDQLYDQSFAPLVQVSNAQTADGYFVTGTGFIAIEVVTGGVKQLAFVKGTAVTIRLKPVPEPVLLEAVPQTYPVTVGGKPVGEVELP